MLCIYLTKRLYTTWYPLNSSELQNFPESARELVTVLMKFATVVDFLTGYSYRDYIASDGGVIDEWWKIENNLDDNRGNIPSFAWRNWAKPRKTLVRIVGVLPAEIQTEHKCIALPLGQLIGSAVERSPHPGTEILQVFCIFLPFSMRFYERKLISICNFPTRATCLGLLS
jgi:hypothetical protein